MVQIRGVNRKHPPALLKKKAGLEVHSKELVSDKTPGTHSLHTLNIRNFCRFCFRKYIFTIRVIYDSKQCFDRRSEFLKNLNNQIALLISTLYIEVTNPQLTTETISKLGSINFPTG